MKLILSTVVGSRLHGTARPDSDEDIRGVFVVPLIDKLSPFREPKDTHWVEGQDVDATAYELAKFCKMAAQGNPSCLEVLVGLPHTTTPMGEELKALLPKFLSKKRCLDAFMGYSRNQEKKFRDSGSVLESSGSVDRKWKYACAHVRTLYQLLHLLRTGELVGTYSEGTAEELRRIKTGRCSESHVMSRVFELENLCREAFDAAPLPDQPDIEAIEAFVLKCYQAG
jgi:uncharacterized protein